MKKFFNELIEGIVIVDENKNISFINDELKRRICAYKYEISKDKLKECIKINNNDIYISLDSGNVINGKCDFKEIFFENKIQYVSIVKWEEDNVNMLKNLTKLLDSMEEMICIRNKEKKYIFVNESFAKYYGSSKEEAKHSLEKDILSKELRASITKGDEYVRAMQGKYYHEKVVNRNNISEYYEITKIFLSNDSGEEYIGAVIKDTTFTRGMQLNTIKAMNVLKENNEWIPDIDSYGDLLFKKFKAIFEKYFETKSFNIWAYDKSKGNLKAYFHNDIIIDKSLKSREVNIASKTVEKYISGDFKNIFYTNYKNKEGNSVKYYTVRYPLVYCNEFLGLLTINYDEFPIDKAIENNSIKIVTKQLAYIMKYIYINYELNGALKESERRREDLSIYLSVASDFIMECDINRNIVDISTGCVDVLGWTKEELLQKKWTDLIHEDDLETTFEFIKNFSKMKDRKKGKMSHINRFRCLDGSYKEILWGNGYYKREDGLIVASGRDITKEKELEHKESILKESLYLDKVRDEFFSNLSHELKTPLTLIMAVVQILEEYRDDDELEIDNEKMNKYIKTLKQNSYRLLRLVNNIIDASKINTGFYNLNLINVNIIEIVEDIVMSVVDYCDQHNINIVFNTEIEEEIIGCDPDKIERVILNLLSNAIKYTNDNGTIFVNMEKEEEFIVISVSDTGIGISEEDLKYVFGRFIQVEDERARRSGGSGIGLSLVKSIVEMHNGVISVESKLGVGTTFKVRIPLQLSKDGVVFREKEIETNLEKLNIEFSDIYNIL